MADPHKIRHPGVGGEKQKSRTVRWIPGSASDKIVPGDNLCFDRDYGTAADVDFLRSTRVEKPSATNLGWYAGVVAAGQEIAAGQEDNVKIYDPNGAHMLVNTDQSCTLGTTVLTLKAGSYNLGGSGQGKTVALARQTVDRSGTDNEGLVQAEVFGLEREDILGSTIVTARSRAVTALPTTAILNNFPLAEMRANPFAGSYMMTDFTHSEVLGATAGNKFASSGGTILGGAGAAGIGELTFTEATDDEGVGIYWNCPIIVSGGKPWAAGIRLHQSTIADTKGNYFFGLGKFPDALALASIITADGTLADEAFVGLNLKEGDGNSVDFVYNEASQTQNEHDPDYFVPVAATYNTFEMYFNGTTIQGYLDGVLTGTAISAVDIAAADFPTAEILRPCFATVLAATASFVAVADWAYAIQAP